MVDDSTIETGLDPQHEIDAYPSTEDVFAMILEKVSDSVASAARGSGSAGVTVIDSISEIVRTAVGGALGMGTDADVATKATLIGVMQGTGEKKNAAIRTLWYAVRTIIRRTAEVSGDMAGAARGVVLGAIASANGMDVERQKAADVAGQVAMEEAALLGPVVDAKVCAALKSEFCGIRVAFP